MRTQCSIKMLIIIAVFFLMQQSAKAAVVQAAQQNLASVARSLPVGGKLKVQGLAVSGAPVNDIELERFQVFTADAKIVVDNKQVLPPPKTAYYRGHISGEPKSTAVLIVPAIGMGAPEGLILGEKGIWKIESQQGAFAAELTARKLEQAELAPLKEFRCGTDSLKMNIRGLSKRSISPAPSVTQETAARHTARVAVETDYEFYALFNNAINATDYVGALFAYISGLYAAEIDTNLSVSYIGLWTQGAESDPWVATSGTLAVLSELRTYWNANKSGVTRTITHMLSGKWLGGGIAYLGVLCNSSYGYGVSASLSSTSVDTSRTVWDTLVVSHEIGHNFGSPHTHGYCDIGGNANPVDLCYSGEDQCSGMAASGLPGIGSLTGGTSGAGNGTIMSYCHLLSGNYGNIAMTFGTGHPYGLEADRVPQQMMSEVQYASQTYPGCLDPDIPPPQESGPSTWLPAVEMILH